MRRVRQRHTDWQSESGEEREQGRTAHIAMEPLKLLVGNVWHFSGSFAKFFLLFSCTQSVCVCCFFFPFFSTRPSLRCLSFVRSQVFLLSDGLVTVFAVHFFPCSFSLLFPLLWTTYCILFVLFASLFSTCIMHIRFGFCNFSSVRSCVHCSCSSKMKCPFRLLSLLLYSFSSGGFIWMHCSHSIQFFLKLEISHFGSANIYVYVCD